MTFGVKKRGSRLADHAHALEAWKESGASKARRALLIRGGVKAAG